MTVKDLIPSFPSLIGVQDVVDAVAHGTTNQQQIYAKYYSTAERVYAEELAAVKVFALLKAGQIRATGRISEIKKGSAARWEAQQYRQHSKLRTYIDAEFWRDAVFAKTARLNTARTETREYTDIRLVVGDCKEHLAEDVRHIRPKNRTKNQTPNLTIPLHTSTLWGRRSTASKFRARISPSRTPSSSGFLRRQFQVREFQKRPQSIWRPLFVCLNPGPAEIDPGGYAHNNIKKMHEDVPSTRS
jgi:hypothetical protein